MPDTLGAAPAAISEQSQQDSPHTVEEQRVRDADGIALSERLGRREGSPCSLFRPHEFTQYAAWVLRAA